MSQSQHCVIVGGGHAAAAFCNAISRCQWPGRLTLVTEEAELPYHRPPLSKAQLQQDAELQPQLIRPAAFYDKHNVSIRTNSHATAIDRDRKSLRLGDEELHYDHLVLATGSNHRRPPISGIDQANVFSLRNVEDARAIRSAAADAKRAIIIGAGFIGLEVAASLRAQGLAVTVIELAPRVLARVASPIVSDFFAALHRHHGVELQLGIQICELRKSAHGITAVTAEGIEFPGDLVVVGTGATANDELAAQAGLETANGIVVDEFNRSSDPAVYAIGDCCKQFNARYDRRLRLESVQNANDQAKTAAMAIAGTPSPHNALPWFWSDQFGLKYQIAGVAEGYDRTVIRGTPEIGSSFSVWHYQGERLLAVDAINDTIAYAVASKLLRADRSPAPEQIADPNQDLKQLLAT